MMLKQGQHLRTLFNKHNRTKENNAEFVNLIGTLKTIYGDACKIKYVIN